MTINIEGRFGLGFCVALSLMGCTGGDEETAPQGPVPSFSLAWSEYPSWSVFGVAHELKLIDGRKGQQGPVEKDWGVDIELKEAEYDPCLVMYGAGQTDAVCITNMDVLNPSLTRASVAVLPTSTSLGADALLVTKDIQTVADLKGRKVYGLAKTVSEYCFVRNLELAGEDPSQYSFSNQDPGAAAMAMQQQQEGYEAIVVWNPYVLETLNKRPDVRVLFDSTKIPGEIIDMVVVADEALKRQGGEDFACAVIDAYYRLNERLADAKTHDATLLALGEKFSHLDLAAMKTVVDQTRFYKTPVEGLSLFTGQDLGGVMDKVVGFCVKAGIVDRKPEVLFGANRPTGTGGFLRFDPRLMQKVQSKRPAR